MARLIEIWLAVHLLSSTDSTWNIKIYHRDGNLLQQSTKHDNLQTIRKQITACLEHIIKQSQKDSVLHKLNITRITQKSNKDLYNLLLGILVILNAIERYCLWRHRLNLRPQFQLQSETSTPTTADLIAKAERLLNIYLYAIRGTSMIPPLSLSPHPSTSIQDTDPTCPTTSNSRIIRTPPIDHAVPRDKKDYRVNYSMISPFIDSLRLEEDDLRRRRDSIRNLASSDTDVNSDGHGDDSDGSEWDGWLWSGVFLTVLER